MRIALSLLTLDPRIAGGTETYARSLTDALRRVGRHEYEVLASRLAPDVGSGLPTVVASGYPTSDTTLGRVRSILGASIATGSGPDA